MRGNSNAVETRYGMAGMADFRACRMLVSGYIHPWTGHQLDADPMAVKPKDLETKTARLRLPVSKKPLYIRISKGLNLGYRRNQGPGTWIMRVADGRGGSTIKAIGAADDFAPADGHHILDFDEAQDRARKLYKPGQAAESIVAVAEALDAYERDLSHRGKDGAGNTSRVRIHLPVELGRKAVSAVTAAELKTWRDGLLEKLAPVGVNRVISNLKAALNLAADHDGRITSRQAWQVGLKLLPNAHKSRNVILDDDTVRRLIAASYEKDWHFGLFVETAAITGARASQIAKITVADVSADPPVLYIPRSEKGRGTKKTTQTPAPITGELLSKFDLIRPAAAPLLVKSDRKRWTNGDHSWAFRSLARRCELDPAEVTLYALRHSSIVRQLKKGVPIRVVAATHDTSVVMIEKTYSRHIADFADSLVRAALL